jgi:hypothetical protein
VNQANARELLRNGAYAFDQEGFVESASCEISHGDGIDRVATEYEGNA